MYRARGTWTTEPGWHRMASVGLLAGVGWFAVGVHAGRGAGAGGGGRARRPGRGVVDPARRGAAGDRLGRAGADRLVDPPAAVDRARRTAGARRPARGAGAGGDAPAGGAEPWRRSLLAVGWPMGLGVPAGAGALLAAGAVVASVGLAASALRVRARPLRLTSAVAHRGSRADAPGLRLPWLRPPRAMDRMRTGDPACTGSGRRPPRSPRRRRGPRCRWRCGGGARRAASSPGTHARASAVRISRTVCDARWSKSVEQAPVAREPAVGPVEGHVGLPGGGEVTRACRRASASSRTANISATSVIGGPRDRQPDRSLLDRPADDVDLLEVRLGEAAHERAAPRQVDGQPAPRQLGEGVADRVRARRRTARPAPSPPGASRPEGVRRGSPRAAGRRPTPRAACA